MRRVPDWPRLVLGYEYDYRRGDEAVTQWGSVTQGGITRNIAPASKEIDERVHIIKFNVDHEIQGVRKRGCRRENCWAFSGVSGRPAS